MCCQIKMMLNICEYMETLNVSGADIFHLSKNQTIYNGCYTLPRGRNEVLKKRNGYDHSGFIKSRYEHRIPNTGDNLVCYG